MTEHEHRTGRTGVAGVLTEMQARLDALPAALAKRRVFLSTYQRTTAAVGAAIDRARFEDPERVQRWDVVFAELYLGAHDAYLSGGAVPRPWRLAFEAPDDLPDLGHVLLGINAHVNYDLPQALIGVISPSDFDDEALMDRRRRDHERIDGVLAERVASEDNELEPESFVDRLLTPLNRLGTKRFLKEARRKVWHNTYELQAARVSGPDAYRSCTRDPAGCRTARCSTPPARPPAGGRSSRSTSRRRAGSASATRS